MKKARRVRRGKESGGRGGGAGEEGEEDHLKLQLQNFQFHVNTPITANFKRPM